MSRRWIEEEILEEEKEEEDLVLKDCMRGRPGVMKEMGSIRYAITGEGKLNGDVVGSLTHGNEIETTAFNHAVHGFRVQVSGPGITLGRGGHQP